MSRSSWAPNLPNRPCASIHTLSWWKHGEEPYMIAMVKCWPAAYKYDRSMPIPVKCAIRSTPLSPLPLFWGWMRPPCKNCWKKIVPSSGFAARSTTPQPKPCAMLLCPASVCPANTNGYIRSNIWPGNCSALSVLTTLDWKDLNVHSMIFLPERRRKTSYSVTAQGAGFILTVPAQPKGRICTLPWTSRSSSSRKKSSRKPCAKLKPNGAECSFPMWNPAKFLPGRNIPFSTPTRSASPHPLNIATTSLPTHWNPAQRSSPF